MAEKRRDTVSDRELQRRVLNEIWNRMEVMESELYPLVGNKKRIPAMLSELVSDGMLKVREREYGQKAKLYSFTEAGEIYCMVSMFSDDLRRRGGEMSLEDGIVHEISGNLRRYFEVMYGGDQPQK